MMVIEMVVMLMPLQEELEACDKYQQQLEDALDAKTAELIALRKVSTLEHQAKRHRMTV